jgi:diacylglycerol kinase family enzyme
VKATLIYNPSARATSTVTPEALQAALRDAGFDPVYRPTERESDLDAILKSASGLVVAVGGDGTFRAVATRVLGKDVYLAIIPMGTANNIARCLGVSGEPMELVAGLRHPKRRPFDVGCVETPGRRDYFLEGAGFGLFAEALALYNPDEGKSILRALKALTETLAEHRPRFFKLVLDGQDISGQYLMVEALNTTAIGLRLKLAPEADPSDGQLEVVCIREDLEPGLLKYAAALVREELEELPAVEVRRGRRLTLAWDGFPMHLDALVRPNDSDPVTNGGAGKPGRAVDPAGQKALVVVEIIPAALSLWLPGPPG